MEKQLSAISYQLSESKCKWGGSLVVDEIGSGGAEDGAVKASESSAC
jgi:hypothetical protein